GSDGLELDLLEAEGLVDQLDVLLGQRFELLLRAGALVLADLLVLDQLLDGLLRVAAGAAHGDAALLGLGACELDVLLAAVLGERRQHHAEGVAVVRRVHTEVRLAQRGLDTRHRGLVVRGDDHGAGLGELQGGQLVQRRRGAVVLDVDALEHRGAGAAGADRGEFVLGDLQGLRHLGFRVLQDARDVVAHGMLLGSRWVFVVHCPAPSRADGGQMVLQGPAGGPRTGPGSLGDDRADALAAQGAGDVAGVVEPEDHHLLCVVHAQAERGGVDDLQPLLEGVVVGDVLELARVGVGARVGVVDAVDAVLGYQHLLAADLQRALDGDGVGGEVRHAGAGAEDDHAALLQVPHGAQRDVGLGDLSHLDGGLHAGGDAALLEEVLQGEALHDGAEHAYVVGAAAVHAPLGELGAAEEVAPADDDGALDALGDALGDLP